jgi:hypothetical protein
VIVPVEQDSDESSAVARNGKRRWSLWLGEITVYQNSSSHTAGAGSMEPLVGSLGPRHLSNFLWLDSGHFAEIDGAENPPISEKSGAD